MEANQQSTPPSPAKAFDMAAISEFMRIYDYEPDHVAKSLDWVIDDLCSFYDEAGADNWTFENLQILQRLRNAFLQGGGIITMGLYSDRTKCPAE